MSNFLLTKQIRQKWEHRLLKSKLIKQYFQDDFIFVWSWQYKHWIVYLLQSCRFLWFSEKIMSFCAFLRFLVDRSDVFMLLILELIQFGFFDVFHSLYCICLESLLPRIQNLFRLGGSWLQRFLMPDKYQRWCKTRNNLINTGNQ